MQNDKLFHLIKSLDKNEKGYFKKQLFNEASTHDKYYIILFDYINAQSIYDEQSIKLKIKDKHLLNYFTKYKSFLYEAILRNLISYHAQTSVKIEIKNLIRNAEMLILKAFYLDAREMLLKALELSQKYEFFILMIEVYDLLLGVDQQLMIIGKSSEKLEKKLMRNQKNLTDTIKRYSNIAEYWGIVIEYNHISLSKELVSNKQKRLSELIQHSHLNNEKNALSLNSKIRHYNINGAIYINYLNNPKVAMDSFKNAYKVYKDAPKIELKEDIVEYLKILNNIMYCSNILKDANSFNQAFTEMMAISTKHPGYKLLISVYTTVNRLWYCIRHNKPKEGLANIKSIETSLENERLSLDQTIVVKHIYISILYLIDGQPKMAASYMKKIFNAKFTKDIHDNMKCFIYYFSLITEYEAGDFEYLDHLLGLVERRIKVLHCDTHIAKKCILFFKLINFQTDKRQLDEAFKKLEQSIRSHPSFIFPEQGIFSVADWAKR